MCSILQGLETINDVIDQFEEERKSGSENGPRCPLLNSPDLWATSDSGPPTEASSTNKDLYYYLSSRITSTFNEQQLGYTYIS